MMNENKKTLMLGLGNPILTDDAIGIKVVEELERRFGTDNGYDYCTGSFGGFHIVDEIRGYDRAVIVDSIIRGGEVGTVYKLTLHDLDGTVRLASPHRVNLPGAIALAKKIEDNIPDDITIYAIEVDELTVFSTRLSPKLQDCFPEIVNKIIDYEMGGNNDRSE